MTREKVTGAMLLFKILEQYGVEHVFGYPGGAIMPIYDALYDSNIKHFLCRHEQGASFSALAYSRSFIQNESSTKVGVCFATSGPGATNLITGLADAMADSIPLVAITGQVATHSMGSDAFQEVDIIGLSLACTKHSFQVRSVEDLADTLQQAFSLALSGRHGPVLVDIPKDIQLASVKIPNKIKPILKEANSTASNGVGRALSLLLKAKKPVIYVGGGVLMANAVEELRIFMNNVQAPSVSTLKGLGSIDCNDPLYLGMLGMHGAKAANLAVQSCDLLIAIGARFDDRVTGKLSEFAPNAKVIHFDIDPAEINKRRTVDAPLLGDLKQNLAALSCSLEIYAWRDECLQLKENNAWHYNLPRPSIYAPALLNELSLHLGNDSVVTTDVGQHQMWVAQHMEFSKPENLLTSGSLGTMGYGLPAAIGAQVARPSDTVVAVSGDGSFMMNVQELATINRYKLPVKIVVIDNSRLGMVKQWQQLFFEKRYSETDLYDNPDFSKLAEIFEINSQRITKHSEVKSAIKKMLNHNGAYLLHVCIDEKENVWPLVPPETANEHMLEGENNEK